MRIIPAIDLINGKCVRLTKGDFATQKIYNENPLEVAKQFEDNGIQYLHLVDLDGAKQKRIVNYNTLEKIASNTKLKIDFGGGIQSNNDIRIAFECGAQQITGGSIAVKQPDIFLQWISTYGADKIILGADVHKNKIAINGWQEESNKELISFLKDYFSKGVKYVITTDIAKDGMLSGPNIALYKTLIDKFSEANVIASGGITTVNDLYKLKKVGCNGAIIGKAIYENSITLKQLQDFILQQ